MATDLTGTAEYTETMMDGIDLLAITDVLLNCRPKKNMTEVNAIWPGLISQGLARRWR